MSDQTVSPDKYTAARERERLGDNYRNAYRAARSARPSSGPTPLMRAAAAAIRSNPQVFDEIRETPDHFIDGIEREIDWELNLAVFRRDLVTALDALDKALFGVRKALREAADYDDTQFTYAMDSGVVAAALTNIQLNTAALRHTALGSDPGDPA